MQAASLSVIPKVYPSQLARTWLPEYHASQQGVDLQLEAMECQASTHTCLQAAAEHG